jgi:hypothetical protein
MIWSFNGATGPLVPVSLKESLWQCVTEGICLQIKQLLAKVMHSNCDLPTTTVIYSMIYKSRPLKSEVVRRYSQVWNLGYSQVWNLGYSQVWNLGYSQVSGLDVRAQEVVPEVPSCTGPCLELSSLPTLARPCRPSELGMA